MRLRLWLLGVSALKKILEVKFLDLGFKGNIELDCALKLKNVIRRHIKIITDGRTAGVERYWDLLRGFRGRIRGMSCVLMEVLNTCSQSGMCGGEGTN